MTSIERGLEKKKKEGWKQQKGLDNGPLTLVTQGQLSVPGCGLAAGR